MTIYQQWSRYLFVGFLACLFFITIAWLFVTPVGELSEDVSPLILQISPTITPTPWPSVSLEELFDETERILPENTVTLAITGDVIPARTVNRIIQQKIDFQFPFEKTAHLLRFADITLINLEAPLVDNCPVTDEGLIFCGDPRFIEGLNFAGVDVANLANNHMANYGNIGIFHTADLLRRKGIVPIGLGSIEYIRREDTTFAFLGYNGVAPFYPNLAPIDKDTIVHQVSEAASIADVVVVSFHWGREYTDNPQSEAGVSPYDPKEIAHLAIDAGAEVIVGNHPHWYQGIEVYNGRIIFYSLGNFIFDQFWSEETKKGFISLLYFFNGNLADVKFEPIYISGIQPTFAKEPLRQEMLFNMKKLSVSLAKLDIEYQKGSKENLSGGE